MGGSWLRVRRAWCALGLAPFLIGASAAEGEHLLATIDKPAVVTARRATDVAAANVAPNRSARLIVSVTGFRPPLDGGPVEVIVKASGDRGEQEIGRFGITPPIEFKAAGPSSVQRFGLPLPKEMASSGPIKLNVYLVPSIGEGKGARLELGDAEIR